MTGANLGLRSQGTIGKPHPSMSCANCSPIIFNKPGDRRHPSGQCSPVSVLDGQVLFHSFHQVPEALGKDFLLGERLAVYQTRPQFIEILLGDRAVSGSGPNSKPGRKEVAGGQASWGLLGLTDAQGSASRSILNFLSVEKTQVAEVYGVPRCTMSTPPPCS